MELGEVAAQKVVAELARQLQPQSRAYAKVISGLISLRDKRAVDAVALKAAIELSDLWLVRYTLGQAYLAAGYPAEAKSEFEACVKRRGEVMALFLDDTPTYRYYSPVPGRLASANAQLIRKLSGTRDEKNRPRVYRTRGLDGGDFRKKGATRTTGQREPVFLFAKVWPVWAALHADDVAACGQGGAVGLPVELPVETRHGVAIVAAARGLARDQLAGVGFALQVRYLPEL